MPNHTLTVLELVAVTDDALRALWSFILDVDLVREVKAFGRPVDEPLRWMLDEPRAMRSHEYRDLYWARPLDVERLLGSRTYATDVELRLDVADPLLDLGGTFLVQGGLDGATCQRDRGGADLRMEISELGSLLFGGVTATELHRAGRLEEIRPGAVRRADVAFSTTPQPWGDTFF